MDGVLRQVAVVNEVVGDLRVVGSICFVEADWPLVGGAFVTRGVLVVWPKRLAKLVRDDLLCDDLSGELNVSQLSRALSAALPPA